MKNIFLVLVAVLLAAGVSAQTQNVSSVKSATDTLKVNVKQTAVRKAGAEKVMLTTSKTGPTATPAGTTGGDDHTTPAGGDANKDAVNTRKE